MRLQGPLQDACKFRFKLPAIASATPAHYLCNSKTNHKQLYNEKTNLFIPALTDGLGVGVSQQ